MRKTTILIFLIFCSLFSSDYVLGKGLEKQEPQKPEAKEELKKEEPKKQESKTPEVKKEPKFVGQFFDIRVPLENYYFIKSVLAVFGNKWGPPPKTPQEEEEYIWDQLLLSYEAFRRGITVEQEEVDKEITQVLNLGKAEFDWKSNKEAYEKWVQEKTGAPTALFENQIRHLLQIEKLRQQIMDSIKPAVSEQEARQEFIKEYNSLSVELVQFDKQKDAEDFYKKAKANQKFWDEEKNKRPNDFKRPGFVSTAFLMDIWKIPEDAIYKMMKMKIGEIHPSAPIHKGFGVFKVLEKRPADESGFAKVKKSYYEKIKRRKQYDGLNLWFKSLKEQAKIKIYEDAFAEETKKGGQEK